MRHDPAVTANERQVAQERGIAYEDIQFSQELDRRTQQLQKEAAAKFGWQAADFLLSSALLGGPIFDEVGDALIRQGIRGRYTFHALATELDHLTTAFVDALKIDHHEWAEYQREYDRRWQEIQVEMRAALQANRDGAADSVVQTQQVPGAAVVES